MYNYKYHICRYQRARKGRERKGRESRTGEKGKRSSSITVLVERIALSYSSSNSYYYYYLCFCRWSNNNYLELCYSLYIPIARVYLHQGAWDHTQICERVQI